MVRRLIAIILNNTESCKPYSPGSSCSWSLVDFQTLVAEPPLSYTSCLKFILLLCRLTRSASAREVFAIHKGIFH